MPIRYAHTNIIAQDWRKLKDFYTQVFECRFVPPERDQSGSWLEKATNVNNAHLQGVHLRLPGHGETGPTLEIYSYNQMAEKPAVAANRKGYGHLAFAVDDVAACLEKVLSYGGQKLGEIVTRDIPGAGTITFTYATDPEGNILELQTWH